MNWLICVIIGVLFLGLCHIAFDIFQTKRQYKLVNEYVNTLDNLVRFVSEGKDTSKEVLFILRYSEDVSNYMNESMYDMPVQEFASDLKYQRYYDLQSKAYKIIANVPAYENRITKEYRKSLLGFLNPLIWFYKGTEIILFIVLGYFIHNGSIEVPSERWNRFNKYFSLLSGAASIIGLFIQLFEK